MTYLYHRSLNQFFPTPIRSIEHYFVLSQQIISSTLIQILQLLHAALYLPTHDINLYCICYINVRASPIALFKRRPSVCLHHVVVNVPECGRVHCVHLHGGCVTVNSKLCCLGVINLGSLWWIVCHCNAVTCLLIFQNSNQLILINDFSHMWHVLLKPIYCDKIVPKL